MTPTAQRTATVPDSIPSAGSIARVGRASGAWLTRRYAGILPGSEVPSHVTRREFTPEESAARTKRLARIARESLSGQRRWR